MKGLNENQDQLKNPSCSTCINIEESGKSCEKNNSFKEIGIGKWLVDQCRQMGVYEPTSVQSFCIPHILEGRDVLGCSKTGTGKTLAFALPILQRLSLDPFGIFALILTPTRELAFQIADQFRALGKPIGLKDVVLVGGRDMVAQAHDLHRRPHIVTATPGRLWDHMKSDPESVAKAWTKVRFLVLDEADRLLDGQYSQQLAGIFKALQGGQRQTLLFSATITDALGQVQQVRLPKDDPTPVCCHPGERRQASVVRRQW